MSGTSLSSARPQPASADELVEKVRRELRRYEHPLFDFDARAASGGVEVAIRFKPAGVEVHTYQFLLQPREIEHSQFPWSFQRRLVATANGVRAVPLGVNLVSASLPRLPMRITLLTLREAIFPCTVP
mgnify:CR=1 FL=1